MSKTNKILDIVSLMEKSSSFVRESYPNNNMGRYDIVTDGDKIGVKFENGKMHRIYVNYTGKKLPFDFSEGSDLKMGIFGSFTKNKLESIEGLSGISARELEINKLDIIENLKGCPQNHIRDLIISNCYRLNTLKYISPDIEVLQLYNLPVLDEYDYESSKKMIQVSMANIGIKDIYKINADNILVSHPRQPLDLSQPVKCGFIEFDSCRFSNIDGLRDYDGTVKISFTQGSTYFSKVNGKSWFEEFKKLLNDYKAIVEK